nr:hypothetical protein [Tanacetum cinerariifolium]
MHHANRLHQPWRSFIAVINKCLSGKSTSYDSLRLSQAQILCGMYHKKNVDFAYLLWEDFVYQVEHKDAKKSNEMYYPSFTKVIIHYFMNKDPSIPRRNKEYYAIASGAIPPKTKASVRKTKSSSETTITSPTVAGIRFSTSAKGKQPAKSTKAKGLVVLSKVAMTKAEQMKLAMKRSLQQTHISQASRSGADEGTGIIPGVPDVPTDESLIKKFFRNQVMKKMMMIDDFVHPKLSVYEEEAKDEESFDPIVQTSKNSDDASLGLNVGSEERQDAEDDDEELYRDVNINLEGRDVQMTDVHTIQEFEDTHVTLTLDLPNFGSLLGFDHRLKTLEADFSEFVQTNQFIEANSFICGIVERYIDQRMNEEVKVDVQIQSDRLRDEPQAKNEEFLNNLDENIQKIIKEKVKEQVKVQVFKILPKLEKTINEKLKAKFLTLSSNSLRTFYAVAADLSKMKLKKILIEKMESNKRRDDANKDEEPSVGSDQGSKRRREGKEPESTSAPKEKATKTTGKSTQGCKYHQRTASESAPAEEPMQTTQDFELAKQADSRSSFNELIDTPVDFSAFLMNRLKVDTLTPELLAGPTYELMKGSCKSLVELEFFLEEVYKVTTDQLDWNNPEGQRYPHNLLKPLPLIVEWHDYKHMDWITVCRDDDKLYKFKEGNFKRLRIQDIEDMLLLLVQGKLTSLTVKERFAFNVSLRMFTRNIVIQRRVEDLQLGVECYQKKLNLTKPDTYHSNLKRKEAYTTYSNPRGFTPPKSQRSGIPLWGATS